MGAINSGQFIPYIIKDKVSLTVFLSEKDLYNYMLSDFGMDENITIDNISIELVKYELEKFDIELLENLTFFQTI